LGVARRILFAGVIAGNPKSGRKVAVAVAALLFAMLLITAFVATRKRTAPLKEPPMHPSTLIAGLNQSVGPLRSAGRRQN